MINLSYGDRRQILEATRQVIIILNRVKAQHLWSGPCESWTIFGSCFDQINVLLDGLGSNKDEALSFFVQRGVE